MKVGFTTALLLFILIFTAVGEEEFLYEDASTHFKAVKSLQYDYVKRLLKSGYDVNRRDDRGRDLWNAALESADIKMLKLFLRYKPDLNALYGPPMFSISPLAILIVASEQKKEDSSKRLKLLLRAGADPDGGGTEAGMPPLLFALLYNQHKAVETLLKYKAKVNISFGPAEVDPIQTIILSKDKEDDIAVLKLLISKGYIIKDLEKNISRAKRVDKLELAQFLEELK